MSKHIITGKDGSKLELGFTYDNGLPTKPIINPAYSTGYAKKENFPILSMYLTDEDLDKLGDLSIKALYPSAELNQIWLDINEHYVVLDEVPAKIIKSAKEKELVYFFHKENSGFIKGTKIG
jgi:hypothetical protein